MSTFQMMRKAKALNLIFYLQANLSISRSFSRGSRIPEQPKSFKLVTVASLDVEWRGSGGLAMSMNEHWLYIQTSSSIFSCIFHSHPVPSLTRLPVGRPNTPSKLYNHMLTKKNTNESSSQTFASFPAAEGSFQCQDVMEIILTCWEWQQADILHILWIEF